MKKVLSLLILPLTVFLMMWPAYGQPSAQADNNSCPNFFWQNQLPQGSQLNDIDASDENTAWAVGDGYTVMKTVDGGNTWQLQDLGLFSMRPQPLSAPVNSVSVVNSNVVWICCGTSGQQGSVSYIFRTLDGGETWDRFTSPLQEVDSNCISALSENVAWISCDDRYILKTTNGGADWDVQEITDVGELLDMMGISAVDENNAWVCGAYLDNYVSVTHDGGNTWDSHVTTSNGGTPGIQAFDDNNAYECTSTGDFVKVNKTGDDWDIDTKNFGEHSGLFCLSFINPQQGWVSGVTNFDDVFVAKTGNAGSDWDFMDYPRSGDNQRLFGVSAVDFDTVWAAGKSGLLIKTTNAGASWSRFDSDAFEWPSGLEGIDASNEKTAWTIGAKGLIAGTTDGGASWDIQQSGVGDDLSALDAVNSQVVWAVGDNGVILKTRDGGRTWSRQESGTSQSLLSVSAISPQIAWASGTGSTLLRTDDGGATWKYVDARIPNQVLCIKALDSSNAWCGTGSNRMLRTADGGQSWEIQELPSPGQGKTIVRTYGISIANRDLAYALVEGTTGTDAFGFVYKTTDGGNNWERLGDKLDTAYVEFYGIDAPDGNTVCVCGRDGSFYKTVDGGNTWTYEMTGNQGFLKGVKAVDSQTQWVVGIYGEILHSTKPFVYSISPDSADNIGTVKIADIAGNGFWDGMEVRLEKGGTEIEATNVNVISPYKATCEYNLQGAAVGAYDVVTTNANGLEGRLTEGFTVTTPTEWYLPEGSTGAGSDGSFETWVLIENPNDIEARVDLTYMTPAGETRGPGITMAPKSRQTINAADTLPNEYSVSTKVVSDLPIVAERSMYWDTGAAYRQSATGSIGLSHLSKDWYLAEGSTGVGNGGVFETWVLLQNPSSERATVQLTYLTPEGSVEGQKLTLDPGTRQTVNVADKVPNEWSVSTVVNSDVPVAAERTTYWTGSEYRQAAQDSVGASGPSREWYMAEGSTASDYRGSLETWVLIENPYDQTANARLYFQLPGRQVEGPEVTLEPYTRKTVNVADTVPNEYSVSTKVVADVPVVAERSTYWNSGVPKQSATDSIGVMAPHTEWLIPEGSTAQAANGSFETWILVQNPGAEAANVKLTYMTPEGSTAGPSFEMPPLSRKSVSVADPVKDNWSVSTRIESDKPVVADRSVYWSDISQFWRSAQSSCGYAPY
jgi:photosystem II stability/assembly factor-like uncharacterized protein